MIPIWKQPASVEIVTQWQRNTAAEHLGIEILEIGDDFIRGRVPVDVRTVQPMQVLHGGVSVVLAETLGSCGAVLATPAGTRLVGLDINANHLRSASKGWVEGLAKPFHICGTTQVWHIELKDEQDRRTCVARLTVAVLSDRPNS